MENCYEHKQLPFQSEKVRKGKFDSRLFPLLYHHLARKIRFLSATHLGRGDGCGADHTLSSANLTNVISQETWSRSGCLLWTCQLRGPTNAKGAPGATDIPSAARFSLVSSMAPSTKVPAES